MLSQDQYDYAAKQCPNIFAHSKAQLLRQAIAVFQKVSGQTNSMYTTMSDAQLIAEAERAHARHLGTFFDFAQSVLHTSYMAVRPDCTFDEAAWTCLLEWYAQPSNRPVWYQPPADPKAPNASMVLNISPPDDVFQACYTGPRPPTAPLGSPQRLSPLGKIDPSKFWGNQTVIPGGNGPVIGTIPNWRLPSGGGPDEAAGAGAGADTGTDTGTGEQAPTKSNTLMWVGVLAALGAAGAGIWYLTKEPAEPKRNPSRDPWAPKPAVKKRMTPQQKKALAAYRFALQQEDRYLGSVFVTPSGQRRQEALTQAAYQECKRLGLGPEHGL